MGFSRRIGGGLALTKATNDRSAIPIRDSHFMKTLKSLALLPISFLAAGSILAQPPDNVSSDSFGNTAMGTDALLDQTTGATNNTAAGFGALTKLTDTSNNTAFGYQALTASTGA